jgi:hypothetical protein
LITGKLNKLVDKHHTRKERKIEQGGVCPAGRPFTKKNPLSLVSLELSMGCLFLVAVALHVALVEGHLDLSQGYHRLDLLELPHLYPEASDSSPSRMAMVLSVEEMSLGSCYLR